MGFKAFLIISTLIITAITVVIFYRNSGMETEALKLFAEGPSNSDVLSKSILEKEPEAKAVTSTITSGPERFSDFEKLLKEDKPPNIFKPTVLVKETAVKTATVPKEEPVKDSKDVKEKNFEVPILAASEPTDKQTLSEITGKSHDLKTETINETVPTSTSKQIPVESLDSIDFKTETDKQTVQKYVESEQSPVESLDPINIKTETDKQNVTVSVEPKQILGETQDFKNEKINETGKQTVPIVVEPLDSNSEKNNESDKQTVSSIPVVDVKSERINETGKQTLSSIPVADTKIEKINELKSKEIAPVKLESETKSISRLPPWKYQ